VKATVVSGAESIEWGEARTCVAKLVSRAGLEPATLSLKGRCSAV
jgi:hypothetical protein